MALVNKFRSVKINRRMQFIMWFSGAFICVCVLHTSVCVWSYIVCMYICVCMYVCMYGCMHVCMCICGVVCVCIFMI